MIRNVPGMVAHSIFKFYTTILIHCWTNGEQDYAVKHGERKYIATDFTPTPTPSSTPDRSSQNSRRSQSSPSTSFDSLTSKDADKDRTPKHSGPATRFSFSLPPPKTSNTSGCNVSTPPGHRELPNNKRKSEAADPSIKKYRLGPPEDSLVSQLLGSEGAYYKNWISK